MDTISSLTLLSPRSPSRTSDEGSGPVSAQRSLLCMMMKERQPSFPDILVLIMFSYCPAEREPSSCSPRGAVRLLSEGLEQVDEANANQGVML